MAEGEAEAHAQFSRKWPEGPGNQSGCPCGTRGWSLGFRKLAEARLEVCLRETPSFSAEEARCVWNHVSVVVVGRWSPGGERRRGCTGEPLPPREQGSGREALPTEISAARPLTAWEAGAVGLDRLVPILDPDLLSLVPHLSDG